MLPPYSTDARNGRSGRSGAAALQRAAGAPKRGLGELNFAAPRGILTF